MGKNPMPRGPGSPHRLRGNEVWGQEPLDSCYGRTQSLLGPLPPLSLERCQHRGCLSCGRGWGEGRLDASVPGIQYF